MLDAISDFWKPSRKTDDGNQIDGSQIELGSTIGFGFVPQAEVSGKRVKVNAINTYIFESDRMTSYVLDTDSNTSISMIIADSEQEKYVAISRKIPLAERATLFENSQLLACMDGDEKTRLHVKKTGPWSAWTADEYKKAISGLKGKIVAGDFRNLSNIPETAPTQEFSYTLLVSNNNEYAFEIEQYADNKMEVYATVYRRLSDIGEISRPMEEAKAAIEPAKSDKEQSDSVAKTASQLAALKPANDERATAKPAPTIQDIKGPEELPPAKRPIALKEIASESALKKPLEMMDMNMPDNQNSKPIPQISEEQAPNPALESLPQQIEPKKDDVPDLNKDAGAKKTFFTPLEMVSKPQQAAADQTVVADASTSNQAAENAVKQPAEPAKPITNQPHETEQKTDINNKNKEQDMATFNANIKGANEPKNDVFQARAIQTGPQEVENDTIDCELPAASRVIEEAIRNEMSMSDVIRRVIALPVARQESVSIPVMLTDSDYSLLAVRYGIPAADRAAIKAKIIEEIGEFSGK